MSCSQALREYLALVFRLTGEPVMPYGGHQSVFRVAITSSGCGFRFRARLTCPGHPTMVVFTMYLGHLSPPAWHWHCVHHVLFPRVAVTQRGIKAREHSLFRTIPASFSFLGYAHGTIYHSIIWNKLLAPRVAREISLEFRNFSSFRPRVFSDLSGIDGHPTPTVLSHLGQSLFPSVDDILGSFASNGPLLSRLILTGALASPIVVISLQRDTVDIGGNQGMLSIGELPAGLAMEDLTWVPLRAYTAAEGGLPAPEESPNEVHQNARIFSTLMNVESDLPHHLGGRH